MKHLLFILIGFILVFAICGYACPMVHRGLDTQKDSGTFRDTLIGFINDDNFPDSIYVEIKSRYQYDEDTGISECSGQEDEATLKIVFGNTGQGLRLEDEETFDYPYSGYSSLSYSIARKGIIVRRCYSSRHSDKVYIDSYYEYDKRLNNLFKIKEIIRQGEGWSGMTSTEKTDSVQVSLDGKCKRVNNRMRQE